MFLSRGEFVSRATTFSKGSSSCVILLEGSLSGYDSPAADITPFARDSMIVAVRRARRPGKNLVELKAALVEAEQIGLPSSHW